MAVIWEWEEVWQDNPPRLRRWALRAGPLAVLLAAIDVHRVVAPLVTLDLGSTCHPGQQLWVDTAAGFLSCVCGELTPFDMETQRRIPPADVTARERWLGVFYDPLQAAMLASNFSPIMDRLIAEVKHTRSDGSLPHGPRQKKL